MLWGTQAALPTDHTTDHAGVIGAATMVIEHVVSPDAVDRSLEPAA